MQQAFDEATSEVARAALAVELHSHAWEALRCPNANHVLQKVALPLCTHPFGNYVMQHLLEHGTNEHKHRLSKALEWQVSVVNVDSYTSAVLRKALCNSSAEDQTSLARAVIATPGLVVSLACSRHGSAAVQHMLHEMQGDDQTEIQRQLMAQVAVLRSSRYGRFVQHHLPLDLEPGA